MPLDQPLLIIKRQPVEERLAELLHRLERAHPYEWLFQRPNEPLCHAVAFWDTDKRRTGCDAQESEFRLKVVTHILTAIGVCQASCRVTQCPRNRGKVTLSAQENNSF
jgi:hypothetical protein